MKTILTLILILSVTVAFGQTSIPISKKSLDKMCEITIGKNQTASICDLLLCQSNDLGIPENVFVKKFNKKLYSNYPYHVKIDSAMHTIKLFKLNHLIYLTTFGLTIENINYHYKNI